MTELAQKFRLYPGRRGGGGVLAIFRYGGVHMKVQIKTQNMDSL